MSVFASVVVPVYNDARRLRSALDALLSQTYPSDCYEVIVADNGSTDTTPRVAEEYAVRRGGTVRLVVEDQIQSSYAARNRGLRAARGEVLAFTDADCVPDPEWLKNGIRALAEPDATCGGGRIVFFYKSARPNVYEYYDSVRKLDQQSYVCRAGFAATANFFARARLFGQYGEFRADLSSGGDYEFGRRLTSAGEKMVYIPDATVRHPARATFHELYLKTKRVARGQRKLEWLGLLDHGRLTWRNWLPTLPCWRSDELLVREKMQLAIAASVLRYANLWTRIRWRAQRKRQVDLPR